MNFLLLLLITIYHIHSKPLGNGASESEHELYSWIYGSTLTLQDGSSYPNYEERYIHHMFNIVRLDCKTYSDLYGEFSNVKTVVCDDLTVGQSPLLPMYINPYITEAARAHCKDLAKNCDVQQHNSCDGTGFGTRLNSYIQPGCSGGAEILWYFSGMDYVRATDGWLCERSSNSGCVVGGHTKAIMNPYSRVVGTGSYHPGYVGDFASCLKFYSPDRNAVVSGIWKEEGENYRFMALFYHPDIAGTISGSVKIASKEYNMTMDIGNNIHGHWMVDILNLKKKCQDYYFKFYTSDKGFFYYPRRGFLRLGESCREYAGFNSTRHKDSPRTLVIIVGISLVSILLCVIFIMAISIVVLSYKGEGGFKRGFKIKPLN